MLLFIVPRTRASFKLIHTFEVCRLCKLNREGSQAFWERMNSAIALPAHECKNLSPYSSTRTIATRRLAAIQISLSIECQALIISTRILPRVCVRIFSSTLSRVPLQDIYRMLYHRACEKVRSSRNALANRLVNDNAPSYIWEGSPSSSPTRTQERHESPCVTIPAAWGKKMPLQGAVPASTRYSREVCLRLKRLYLPRRGDVQEKPQPAVRP